MLTEVELLEGLGKRDKLIGGIEGTTANASAKATYIIVSDTHGNPTHHDPAEIEEEEET